MRKVSSYDKAKSAITLLYQISAKIIPQHKHSQLSNLQRHGFITDKLELTPKGEAKAKLFSLDEYEFKQNIKQLLKPKTKKESSETMPLFYEDCAICSEEKKKFQDYVNADVKYLEDGGIPPVKPEVKNIHMDKPTNILDSSKAPIGELGDTVQSICKILEPLPPALRNRVMSMTITLLNIDLGYKNPK